MAYRFIPSWYDYGTRKGPVRAIVTHFTEGGGSWPDVYYAASAAARIAAGYPKGTGPARGVSVHFMILGAAAGKDDGLIVQMLHEDHASGSLNPNIVRTTDDPGFTSPDGVGVTFGVTAAKAALGSWWRDPNSAVISIEVAGKAANGPTPKQTASLAALHVDLRTRYPGAHALGHRDFQDEKPCPGKLVRWGSLLGHGAPKVPEVDMPGLAFTLDYTAAKTDADRAKATGTAKITGAGHDLVNTALRKPDIFDVADGLGLGSVLLGTVNEDVPGIFTKGERAVFYNVAGYTALHCSPMRDVTFIASQLPAPATPTPVAYDVTVGGKEVGKVTLP